jgi:hypothetical protein
MLFANVAFVMAQTPGTQLPSPGGMLTDASVQSVALVFIALFNMVGLSIVAFFQYKTIAASKKTTAAIGEVHVLATKTELNTNSMREALVAATRAQALKEGAETEKIAGDARRDAEEKGREEIRASEHETTNPNEVP